MLKTYGWKCWFLSASKDTKVLHLSAYRSQVLAVPVHYSTIFITLEVILKPWSTKVLSRMNLNLNHSQGLPLVRQWIWLFFTPIIPVLNSSNKVSVLSSVLERKVLFFLRRALQVNTCPGWNKLLAWKHGFGSDVIAEYCIVQSCFILHPFQWRVYILINNSSSMEFRWQWFLFTSH